MEPSHGKYIYHFNPYFIWIEDSVGVKLVGLYGLIPNSNESGESNKWPKACVDLLAQVFADCKNGLLLFKLRYSVDGSAWCGKHHYGDICVKLNSSGKSVNIAELIQKKGFASRNPTYFDDFVVKQLMNFQLTKAQIKEVSRAIYEAEDSDNNSEHRSEDSHIEPTVSKRTPREMAITETDSEFSIGKETKKTNKTTERFTEKINLGAIDDSRSTKPSLVLKNFEVATSKAIPINGTLKDELLVNTSLPKENDKTGVEYNTSPDIRRCFTRVPKNSSPLNVVVMPAGMSIENYMMSKEKTKCVNKAGTKDSPSSLSIGSSSNIPIIDSSIISYKPIDSRTSGGELKISNMSSNPAPNKNNNLSLFDKVEKFSSIKTPLEINHFKEQIISKSTDIDENTLEKVQKLTNPHNKEMPHKKREKNITGIIPPNDKNYANKSNVSKVSGFIEGVIKPHFMVHKKLGSLSKPWLSMNDAPFSEKIHRNLTSLNIKRPMPTQQVVWPFIMQGDSVFLVEGKKTGKTMSFLPPICNQLLDDDIYHDLPRTHGPMCLVLCADSHSVCKIRDLCKALLRNSSKKLTVLAILPTSDNNENITLLFNGCDILISTPFCITKLLDDDLSHTRDSIDFRRVVHLVIDNVEIMDKKCPDELRKIHSKCLVTLKKRIHKEIHLQTVVTSTAWCQLLNYLVKLSQRPVVCIGYNHECVLYSGTSANFRIIENCAKAKTTVDILGMEPLRNTVIVCNDDSEVLELVSLLKISNYPFLYCHNSTSIDMVNDVRMTWKKMCKNSIVIVCCDNNLNFLNITEAYSLIHYSLPDTFKKFSYRFSSLNANYNSIFEDNFDDKKVKIELFLDEENTLQLPKVVNFMKRCNMKVSAEVEKIAEDIILAKNISYAKKNIPLCKELVNFGSCSDQWFCKYRHAIVPAIDKPPEWIPKLGWITFKIIHVHSLTHFTCRIMEHITPLGETHTMPNNEITLAMSLWSHYESDKRYIGEVKINDICGLELRKNHYVRCKVLSIEDKDKLIPEYAKVNLIDEGKIKKVRLSDLLYLTTTLKEINTYTLEINLSGFVPTGQDSSFPSYAKDHLIKEMQTLSGSMYKGSIQLALGNTMWIDSFQSINKLSCGSTGVNRHFTSYIINNNFATVNPNHMPNLYALCNKFKFDLPERPQMNTKTKRRVILPTPQWAHLEPDQLTPVTFSYGNTPDQFYINMIKWEDQLAYLSQDIKRYIECTDFQNSSDVCLGDYCLAKYFDDDLFYRARVDRLASNKLGTLGSTTSEENNERQLLIPNERYHCFFVDHGDEFIVSYSDIRCISERLITQLPFQAIECRLIGVKPIGKVWSDMSINCLDNLCFVSGRTSKYLRAQYFLKEKSEGTNGNKYAIVLLDTTAKREIVINDVFLEANVGQCVDKEYCYIEEFKLKRSKVQMNVMESGKVDSSVSEQEKFFDSGSDQWDFQFDEADLFGLKNQFKEGNVQGQTLPMIMDKQNQERNSPALSVVHNNSQDNCNKSQISSNSASSLSANDDDFEAPQVNMKVPLVNWSQNIKQVTLKIQLTGVKDYKLKIMNKRLHFLTFLRGDKYALNLKLYGAVIEDTLWHEAKGLYILVKMTKIISKKWVFLTTDEIKPKFIIYDCVLCVSDDDESNVDPEEKLDDHIKYYDSDSSNSDAHSDSNYCNQDFASY